MKPGNLGWQNDEDQIARLYYLAISFDKWEDGSDVDSEISTLIKSSGDPFLWFKNHTGMKIVICKRLSIYDYEPTAQD